jgi:hypothetical protein
MVRTWAWIVCCFLVVLPTFCWAQEDQESDASPGSGTLERPWSLDEEGAWDPGWQRQQFSGDAPWRLNLIAGTAYGQPTSSGFVAEQGREYYAMATLQLPLEGWSTPRAETAAGGGAASGEDDRSGAEDSAAGSLGSSVPARPAGEGDRWSPPPSATSETEGALDDQPFAAHQTKPQSQSKQLPGITSRSHREQANQQLLTLTKNLLQRVQRAEGQATLTRELQDVGRRARLSGLVPELRLRGVYAFDETVSQEDSAGIYPGDSTTRGGRDSLLEARLTFRLDRLMYGDQEAVLFQKKRDLLIDAQKRSRMVSAALSQWLTARRKRADPSLLLDEWTRALKEEEDALLLLHVATDGWFEGESTLDRLGLHVLLADLVHPGRDRQPEGAAAPHEQTLTEEQP